MIYSLLLPYTNKMYVTEINQDFEGDALFPKINLDEWQVVKREAGVKNEKNNLEYEYVTYERIEK